MAGESPIAFTADVASNAGVDFHVLLQRCLGLETLPTEQAEDGHVRPCREGDTTREFLPIFVVFNDAQQAGGVTPHTRGLCMHTMIKIFEMQQVRCDGVGSDTLLFTNCALVGLNILYLWD